MSELKEAIELLPCPFCGGKPGNETYPGTKGYFAGKSVIACYNSKICKADLSTDWQPSYEEAAKVWNTRTYLSELSSLRARLERYEKALEVYADESNWTSDSADYRGYNLNVFTATKGTQDGFDLARRALESEGK